MIAASAVFLAFSPASTASAEPDPAPKCAAWDFTCWDDMPGFSPPPWLDTGQEGPDPLKAVGGEIIEASIYKPLSDAVEKLCADLLTELFTFWLHAPSVEIERSGALAVWGPMLFVGQTIAVLLLMLQMFRSVLSRKGIHLIESLQGLAIAGLWTAGGVVIIQAALTASDLITEWILDVGNEALEDRAVAMVAVLGALAAKNPVAGIVFGLAIVLVGLIQLIVLFLRQAAIPLLAVLLPVVAAGQVGGSSSRQWLPRYLVLAATVIVYKPGASVILAVGFTEMGQGKGILDFIRGLTTLTLAVIALPAMMRLFSVFGLSYGGSGGGSVLPRLADAAHLLGGRGGGAGEDSEGSGDPGEGGGEGGSPAGGSPQALAIQQAAQAAQEGQELADEAATLASGDQESQPGGDRPSDSSSGTSPGGGAPSGEQAGTATDSSSPTSPSSPATKQAPAASGPDGVPGSAAPGSPVPPPAAPPEQGDLSSVTMRAPEAPYNEGGRW